MKDIVIFGSGGFAAGDVTWLIEDINEKSQEWNLLGFIDDDESEVGKIKKTYEVLGTSEWLKENKGVYCVLAIGNGNARSKVYNKIKDHVAGFPTLIHPSVEMSKHVIVGEGCIIMPGALVSGGTEIGDFVILNLNTNVGHDVKLKDYSIVAPGASISGWVEVGKYSDIGTNSAIRQLIKIGENSIIGAGSVVVKDVEDNVVVAGVPSKVIKENI